MLNYTFNYHSGPSVLGACNWTACAEHLKCTKFGDFKFPSILQIQHQLQTVSRLSQSIFLQKRWKRELYIQSLKKKKKLIYFDYLLFTPTQCQHLFSCRFLQSKDFLKYCCKTILFLSKWFILILFQIIQHKLFLEYIYNVLWVERESLMNTYAWALERQIISFT